jgi:hypothetical protein
MDNLVSCRPSVLWEKKVTDFEESLKPDRLLNQVFSGSASTFCKKALEDRKFGLFGADNIGFNFGALLADESDPERGTIVINPY